MSHIISDTKVIDDLLKDKDGAVVCGASFGDEGKGKMIAVIAEHDDVSTIARVNSGENAGHTVHRDGKKFVFHLMPSAVLTGKQTVIGDNCVMDPLSFLAKEYMPLIETGFTPNLFLGNVHIVTPYHKIMDALGSMNSSTLKGMSPVHASKATKRGARLTDLFNSQEALKSTFERDMEAYFGMLSSKQLTEQEVLENCLYHNRKVPGRIPEHVLEFLTENNKTNFLINLYRKNVVENLDFPRQADTTQMLQRVLARKEKVLLEAAQSYWLSNTVNAYWRSSTSADGTAAGVIAAAGINPAHKFLVINVHKTPGSSRVGAGANPAGWVPQDYFVGNGNETLTDLEGVCDDFYGIQHAFFDSSRSGNETTYQGKPIHEAMAIAAARHWDEQGATTRKPRVLGWFDAIAHARVMEAQGPYTFISALDRGNDCDSVGMVTAYEYTGDGAKNLGKTYRKGDIIRIGDSYPDETVLKDCKPIVKLYDSWRETPLRKGMSELPLTTQRFLNEVEDATGAKIIGIGVGPKSDDVLYLR